MKRTRMIVALLLSMPVALMAGEMNEAAFKTWMSNISIDGTRLLEIEKDGDTLNAMFVNSAKPQAGGRMISISPLKGFVDYQKTVDNPKMRMGPTMGFTFQGMRTVVVDTQSEIGMMAVVEAKNIGKTFVVSFPSNTSRATIESTLVKTGVYQKK